MVTILKSLKILIFIIFIMLATNFALNNQSPITIDLGPFAKYINIDLYIFTIIVFVLGAITASAFFVMDSFKSTIDSKKKSWLINKLQKQVTELSNENSLQHEFDSDDKPSSKAPKN